jgi:hypothetical protein
MRTRLSSPHPENGGIEYGGLPVKVWATVIAL